MKFPGGSWRLGLQCGRAVARRTNHLALTGNKVISCLKFPFYSWDSWQFYQSSIPKRHLLRNHHPTTTKREEHHFRNWDQLKLTCFSPVIRKPPPPPHRGDWISWKLSTE